MGPDLLRHDHLVELYDSDADLAASVRAFLAPAVDGGDTALVVATAAHRAAFAAAFAAAGHDLGRAEAAGRYVALDAAEVLAGFMVDGMPDPARFRAVVGPRLAAEAAAGRRVRIYGEMVALLWAAGRVGAAVALEDLWNALAAGHEFALLCAYPSSVAAQRPVRAEFELMCAQHTRVVLPGSGSRPPPPASGHAMAPVSGAIA